MNAEYLDFPFEIKATDVEENGIFTGYASIFNKVDDSRRYIDGIFTEGDIVRQGAFKDSIAKGGRNENGIVMLWNHQSDQVPGVWLELEENKKGLKVKGELLLETQLGKETHIRLKKKATKGLSIGFDTIDYKIDEKKKIREIKKAELWEISPVTFPAQKRANVIDVKTLEDCKTERDLEDALRESGLSRTAIQYIIKLCKPSLRESGKVNDDDMSKILQSLKSVNAGIDLKCKILGL